METAPSRSSAKISIENLGEPVTLVRSPITTNPNSGVILRGSKPDSRSGAFPESLDDTEVVPPIFPVTGCGGSSRACLAKAAICAGVVPQQPPTMLSQPLRTHFKTFGANVSGVSGNPVSESG